jgi:hypothetical protein
MSIEIQIKSTIILTCENNYRNQKRSPGCADPVEVEGTVTLENKIEIDSVPDYHDIARVEFETPEGWLKRMDCIYCPRCAEKKDYR